MLLNKCGSTTTPPLTFFFFLFLCASSAYNSHEQFLQCLSRYSKTSSRIIIYTPASSSYSSVLEFNIQNTRFNTTSTPKPFVIVIPTKASHIQATINCARKYNVQVIARSGGHDLEGLSYVSPLPFVMIDLVNLRKVVIDYATNTAWVQAGATLGEVYYQIAKHNMTLAFPAGDCPTVGTGGHISGGGYGILMRKYGLAADNVNDAKLIDVNGNILDRSTMGEDLFWAIRGGGGNTFGVVFAWKIQLVPVPPTVTIFSIPKTLEQNATKLIHRWQFVSPKLPDDIWLQLDVRTTRTTNSTPQNDVIIVIRANFNAMFLGGANQLVQLMQERFPDLGVTKEDCHEMPWSMALANFGSFTAGLPIDVNISLSFFITPSNQWKVESKTKSDYVKEGKPMPEEALEGMMRMLQQVENAFLFFIPYGGRMNKISSSSLPFPHRAGTLYKIGYGITWNGGGERTTEKNIAWLRRLHHYLTPYVSKNPRSAYINYRDLDVGMNNIIGTTSYEQARFWGVKYFGNNFDKLIYVKTKVDPTNFFRNLQSIPPLSS